MEPPSLLYVVLSLLFIYYVFAKVFGTKWINLPPGPRWIPIIGNYFSIKKDLITFVDNTSKTYGDVAMIYLLHKPIILLSSLKAVKEAFHQDALAGRIRTEGITRITHDSGFIFRDGPDCMKHRRLTLRILRDFGVGKKTMEDFLQKEALDLCEDITSHADRLVETNVYFSTTSSNVICSLVFGARPGYKGNSEFTQLISSFRDATQNENFILQLLPFFTGLINIMPYLPFQSEILKGVSRAHAFVTEKIQEHRERFQMENEPSDFIDAYLLEQRKSQLNNETNFDDWKIIRMVLELFLAGSETTATQLSWTVLYLALHEDVRLKMREEIIAVCGTERVVNVEDKKKMNYTQAVLEEVLRLGTVVPLGGLPHRTRQQATIQGFTVPEDAIVVFNFHSISRDPKHWKYPQTFDPRNFLDDDGNFTPNEHNIPFSTGKRACIGESLARMELFIFAVTLVQRFRFELKLEEDQSSLESVLKGTEGGVRSPGRHKIKFIPLERNLCNLEELF